MINGLMMIPHSGAHSEAIRYRSNTNKISLKPTIMMKKCSDELCIDNEK